MVQDKLLSEEAYRRGLDRVPFVAHETEKWNAKLLYLAHRSALMRTITLSDSAVQAYFTAHKKKYQTGEKKSPSFTNVKQAVSDDYYNALESLVLLREIDMLKQKYAVTINEEVLHTLSKNAASDPRAIETIFYKPGGTFPRVAFPTIDEAWSRVQ
ncbi:MAG: hypothetical protein HYV29_03680 [Ignavibacteriales bacterium]|nr:hypothetical protein [Ignavibacteriales bacterium]